MKSLTKLIAKDFKILFRSKLTASLIIFGPLLLIILVGFALNSQGMQNIQIGITNTSDAELNRILNDITEENAIIYNDIEQCKLDVSLGVLHSCIELPKEVKKGEQNKIKIHIDPSKIQLAIILGRNIESYIQHESTTLSAKLANEIISIFNKFKINLDENIVTIENITSKSENMKDSISEIDTEVSEIDIIIQGGLQNTTNIQNQINSTYDLMEQFIEINNQTISEALFYTEYLQENKNYITKNFDGLESNITLAKSLVEEQKAQCEEKQQQFQDLLDNCVTEEDCTLMQETVDFLNQCIEQAQEAQQGLSDLYNEINTTKETIAVLDSTLNETEISLNERIELMDTFTEYANQTIVSIEASLKDFKSDLNNTLDLKESMMSKINQLETVLDDTQSRADSLKTKLNSLNKEVKTFSNVTARGLVEPFKPFIIRTIGGYNRIALFFPYLIILVIMLVCIFSSVSMVNSEKESRASVRSFISPTKPASFILSTYLTILIISFLQVILILTVGKILFYVPIFNHLPFILISSLLAASFFIFLGMLMGYFFENIEVSMVLGVSISAAFLLISPLSYPIEGLAPFVINLAPFNPFVLATEAIRKMMIVNKFTRTEMLLLAGYALYLGSMLTLIYKKIRMKMFD